MPDRLARAVADRVVSLVIDALDVDALLRRVDMNALLDQIDVDRLLERIDVDALLERIDVNALLAQAATGSADEALTVLRQRAAQADDSVSRWTDRLMGRT
ncbi:MAG TPA: hypothetical protein VGJ86_13240 [Acidimicrobiales bacterium]|jgi:hypothetical protein